MPFICAYPLCEEAQGKIIPEGEASTCARCETGKPMHKSCCRKHNENRHRGKGQCQPLKEIDFPTPITLR